MFESMTGFLIFFFVVLALILLGILFEEYLIAFECALAETLRPYIRAFMRAFVRAFRAALRRIRRQNHVQRGCK